jgi:hypothetical protein
MKWKFENIDVIFSCHENDFERTSNYSRNKLNTNDRIIYLDNPIIDGNDSVNAESNLLEDAENPYDSHNVKPRRKAAKVPDVLAVLGDNDSPIDY